MNFTGERVIPGEVDADLFNEHWARYLFAARYAAGKRVLDAACGSGYGSALLAKDAALVAGVDIAREAVEYASHHYGSPKTLFAQADCYSLPFVSAQFDLVVAYEIIEHLAAAKGFLEELRRVLAPGGLLLISTPNRLYYTEDRAEVNPFHIREFSYAEFQELLRAHFLHWTILFENHVPGLLLASPGSEQEIGTHPDACLQIQESSSAAGAEQAGREAHYMIALCSAQPLPEFLPLLYLPAVGNVLRERENHIRSLHEHLERERTIARTRFEELEAEIVERTQWANALNQQLSGKDTYVLQLQADYDLKLQWAKDLQQEVEKARSELQKLQKEFEERTAWALRLNRDLEFLYNTRWYRIGRKLRMDVNPPAGPPDGKS